MAIELNNRTKILAGVVVLLAAGAGAWFFFLEDFLNPPPPRPAASTSAKAAAKPSADAQKAGEASKAAGADAAAKTAVPAAAAPPPATPVPTDPDKVVAEFLDVTGARAQLQQVAREVMNSSSQIKDPAAAKQFEGILKTAFEPDALIAEVTNNLKTSYDGNRMPRYLDLMRQPIAQKVVQSGQTFFALPREEMQSQIEAIEKNPPPAERAKLVARIEELRRSAGLGSEIGQAMGKGYVDGVLAYLQASKAGKPMLVQIGGGDARNARAALTNRSVAARPAQIQASLARMTAAYRNLRDAELADYLKLIDSELGEWGAKQLAAAVAPAMEKRGRVQGRAFAQFNLEGKTAAAKAIEPAPAPPAGAQRTAPAERPAARAPAPAETPAASAPAPVEQTGYRRAPGIREVYTRYNDVVSATVMRDAAAVKELLDDGKSPNSRQRDGLTALMIAAANGDTDIAALLLAKGADPNARAFGGRSALSMARARGADGAGMVQALQRSGAKD